MSPGPEGSLVIWYQPIIYIVALFRSFFLSISIKGKALWIINTMGPNCMLLHPYLSFIMMVFLVSVSNTSFYLLKYKNFPAK